MGSMDIRMDKVSMYNLSLIPGQCFMDILMDKVSMTYNGLYNDLRTLVHTLCNRTLSL